MPDGILPLRRSKPKTGVADLMSLVHSLLVTLIERAFN